MVTEDEKKEFNELYKAYYSIKEEIKEMNGGLRDSIKILSKKLEIKPAILSKTLASLYKKSQTGESELEDIMQVIVEMESKN